MAAHGLLGGGGVADPIDNCLTMTGNPKLDYDPEDFVISEYGCLIHKRWAKPNAVTIAAMEELNHGGGVILCQCGQPLKEIDLGHEVVTACCRQPIRSCCEGPIG